jgi:hypothetical protein
MCGFVQTKELHLLKHKRHLISRIVVHAFIGQREGIAHRLFGAQLLGKVLVQPERGMRKGCYLKTARVFGHIAGEIREERGRGGIVK